MAVLTVVSLRGLGSGVRRRLMGPHPHRRRRKTRGRRGGRARALAVVVAAVVSAVTGFVVFVLVRDGGDTSIETPDGQVREADAVLAAASETFLGAVDRTGASSTDDTGMLLGHRTRERRGRRDHASGNIDGMWSCPIPGNPPRCSAPTNP